MHAFGHSEEAGLPTHALGGHADSTPKGWSQDLNQEPPCCEMTVQTTTSVPENGCETDESHARFC